MQGLVLHRPAPHLPLRDDAQPLGAGHAQRAQRAQLRQPAAGVRLLVDLQGQGCQAGAALGQHLFQLSQGKAQPGAGHAVRDVQRQADMHSVRSGAERQPTHEGAQAGQEEGPRLGGGAQARREALQQRWVVGQALPAAADERQRPMPAGAAGVPFSAVQPTVGSALETRNPGATEERGAAWLAKVQEKGAGLPGCARCASSRHQQLPAVHAGRRRAENGPSGDELTSPPAPAGQR